MPALNLNYLAHQYLSFEQEPLMVGNFIADGIRGRDFKAFPVEIAKGITLHRHIDHFTDNHPLTLESRKLLYPHFGKYAQVVQDVYYDHFLARDWPKFHEVPLAQFAEKVYRTMRAHPQYFNEKAARTLHYMQLHNWLLGYACFEGVDRALKGMASRANFASGMERGLPPLQAHFNALHQQFSDFWPELERAAKAYVDADFGRPL